MSFENTQLTNITKKFDTKNLIFGKPRDGSIPNSTVVFKRIPIGVRNPDGTLGELVIPTTENLYSFGLSPNTNMTTGKIDGYTLSLCLWNKDAPTDEQKVWVDNFTKIIDSIKDYLISHRDNFEKYDLDMAELKKFNPLYYKTEKGKRVEGAGPVLYPKVLQNKKNDIITTPFCNEHGEDIDPMTLLNKACKATAAIKIESVFIGAKISLQVKVYEAQVKLFDNSVKRLLRKPEASSKVVMEDAADDHEDVVEAAAENAADDQNDDDDGSVKASDDESEEEPAPPAPVVVAPPVAAAKAPVRRVVRKA
jgi:hypothetical protein